jgi:MinD superfamily P-loop ATPase
MKQLVIVSGKGGTGKTSFTSMLAYEIHQDKDIVHPIFVDADVDAANLELILGPETLSSHSFSGYKIARIDPALCTQCLTCVSLCRFDAVHQQDGTVVVDEIACEGCYLCAVACPEQAIQMQAVINGDWFHSDSRFGNLFHANLYPGQENSGKLVTHIKQEATKHAKAQNSQLITVDGPPGIGCPVIAAITGVDLVVIITEPTLSGISDLARTIELTNHFGIPGLVVVNKASINPALAASLAGFCQQQSIPIIGSLPYDSVMVSAMVAGKTLQEFQQANSINQQVRQIWLTIKSTLFKEN